MLHVETFTVTNREDEAIPRPDVEQMTKLKEAQRSDPELLDLCRYLEADDVLPTEETKQVVRIRVDIIMVFFTMNPRRPLAACMCVVVPRSDNANLLQEDHASFFAGYFSAGIRADVYHGNV